MKRTLFAAALCGALTIALIAPSSFAQVSSSTGKNSAYTGGVVWNIPLGDYDNPSSVILSATIPKGKPKRVVLVEAMGMVLCPFSCSAGIRAKVNGVEMIGGLGDWEPWTNVFFVICDAIATGGVCPLAGTWYLDLDEAEAANPGMFKKQPLVVELLGECAAMGGPNAFHGTMVVHMNKK